MKKKKLEKDPALRQIELIAPIRVISEAEIGAFNDQNASRSNLFGVVKVTIEITPELEECNFADTLKTMLVKPTTIVSELEESLMEKLCTSAQPLFRAQLRQALSPMRLLDTTG